MARNSICRGRRFGFFPAGALAWVISKENFLKDSKVVNYLKLRASYGKVGGSAFTGGSATDRIYYQQFYYNSGHLHFRCAGYDDLNRRYVRGYTG